MWGGGDITLNDGADVQTKLDEINSKLNNIKIIHRAYTNPSLNYNDWLQMYLGILNYSSEVDKYGYPISAYYVGGSSAPGYCSINGSTIRILANDMQGTLYVNYIQGIPIEAV